MLLQEVEHFVETSPTTLSSADTHLSVLTIDAVAGKVTYSGRPERGFETIVCSLYLLFAVLSLSSSPNILNWGSEHFQRRSPEAWLLVLVFRSINS